VLNCALFGPEGLCISQAMDGTTKRLKIADVVTNMFRSVLALSPGAQEYKQTDRCKAVHHS
jgi:hypothetical protein